MPHVVEIQGELFDLEKVLSIKPLFGSDDAEFGHGVMLHFIGGTSRRITDLRRPEVATLLDQFRGEPEAD